MELRNKAAVVTGAASGIGKEAALAFARRGARLAIVDIDEAKLLDVKGELERMGVEVYSHVVDVSDATQVEKLCEDVYEEMGRVDVLYNNAGIGIIGRFEDATLEDCRRVVGVNLWGVIHGCHYFYPRMIAQGGGGHIVNQASGAGLAPIPMNTAYCCTKYAVVGLSETLRAEAALHGIGVSVICPGTVNTPFKRSAKITSSTDRSSASEIQETLVRIYELLNYTPDRVAAAAVKAVERNKGVVPVCLETYLGDWLHRLSRTLNDACMKMLAKLMLKWL